MIQAENQNMSFTQVGSILGVILMGSFVTILNQTLMSTALPSIMKEFSITATQGQWLTTAYMLINGIMVPITAYLVNRFTTRQLYLFSMIVFSIGTFVAATSNIYGVLIIGRMIQAIGAGIILPLQMIVILYLFPIEKRGSAMGLIGLAMNFAPAIGPTFSGWVVQNYQWNMLFYFILPFAIIDVVVAFFILKNVGETSRPKLDGISVIYSTLGFGGLLFGLSNASSNNFISANVALPLIIGVVSLVLLVNRSNRSKEPLLNFSIFKYKGFRLNLIISFVLTAGMYGAIMLLPIYFQTMRGMTPMESGMVLLPGSIVMAIMSPITGRMFDKYGSKRLAMSGLVLVTIGTFIIGLIDLNTPIKYIVLLQIVRSLGFSLTLMPIQTAAFNAVPLALASHASAMFNTQRQLAGSMGTALFVVVMTIASQNGATQHLSPELSDLAGFQMVFKLVGLFSLAAFIMTLFIKEDLYLLKVKPVGNV
ncbi:drug resistance transporter, EmrB/QacA subfamily [Carnobacterium alterfunditum]|uniref:Drug resistance transporter, EmrB/QacA subfamily n=1 Tax=Carnobacterium alterfunditum TaxID=28230 RepID=A0A1N6EK35_9LACT|nr:MDR family MFS transporter [Carnobacterium alterfunditum]SIN83281.1 drug resistance transporter, EmrB/QacA subfamily [Carnobacterium alterfunditum]